MCDKCVPFESDHKHKLVISGVIDNFLEAYVYFVCTICEARLGVDRIGLYRSMLRAGHIRR